MLIDVRDEQPLKAAFPIVVTDGGILMVKSERQNPNAADPILVIDVGMVTVVNDEQL